MSSSSAPCSLNQLAFGALALASSLLASSLSAAGVEAQAPDIVTDETYSFYSTRDERTVQEGTTRHVTWMLNVTFRAFSPAAIPRDSVLRYELRQGTRRLAGVRCPTTITSATPARADQPLPNTIVMTSGCYDTATQIRETGEMQVVWFFINGDDDRETQLASHTITVRELPVYTRALPPVASEPHMIVDRHAEVLSAFVFQGNVPPAQVPEFAFAASNVFLQFNAATEAGDALHNSSVRCRLNGARVEIPNARIFGRANTEELDVAWMPVAGATVPNEAAAEEYVRFRRYTIALPLMVPPLPQDEYTVANRVAMTPGAWECDVRSDTQVTLRTFRWTVGVDGLIAAHAEETEGGLRLPPGVHFVESLFPADHPLDARTDPSQLARALHGRGLRSAAARALSVPAVGVPYPVAPRGAAGRTTGRTARPRR